MEPLDVDVEIRPDGAGSYWVEVRSPAGEVRVASVFPFDAIALENRLQALQIALLTSAGGQRADISPNGQAVQEFASSLFQFLFVGEARSCYERSRDQARDQGAALRIRLRCQAPELASLPWEFLFDAQRNSYLSLSRRTQVVRYLEIPERIAPLRVTPPLRILGVVASPDDLPAIDVNRDRERLERSVAKLQRDGLVVLEWLPEPTWRSLQQALRQGQWHVFHFSGHGSFDRNKQSGQIAFVDDAPAVGTSTSTRWLSADELGTLLGDTDSLRLAVLNACEGATADAQDIFSGTAASLVRRGTPAVVAMQYAISDRAAIELARAFYESLADGLAVDTALAEARKAMYVSISGTLEWGTPVLFMRTNSGVLFDVDHERPAPPPEAEGEVDAPPILELSTTSIDLGNLEPQEVPPSTTVEVRNRGGGTLDWFVDTAPEWIELERDENSFTVIVHPEPGVNHAEVIVGDRSSGARESVSVRADLLIEATPRLQVSRREIDLGTVALDASASQEVEVTNAGDGVLEVEVVHADAGLEANYRDGVLGIVFNASTPGVFAGDIELGGNGGDATLHVTALIEPPVPRQSTPVPSPPDADTPVDEHEGSHPRRRKRIRPWLVIGVPIIILILLLGSAVLRSGDDGKTSSYQVNLPGNSQDFVPTDVVLHDGDQLTIEASGKIGDDPNVPTNQWGPAGNGEKALADPFHDFDHAALIGRIGDGEPFLVGEHYGPESAGSRRALARSQR